MEVWQHRYLSLFLYCFFAETFVLQTHQLGGAAEQASGSAVQTAAGWSSSMVALTFRWWLRSPLSAHLKRVLL